MTTCIHTIGSFGGNETFVESIFIAVDRAESDVFRQRMDRVYAHPDQWAMLEMSLGKRAEYVGEDLLLSRDKGHAVLVVADDRLHYREIAAIEIWEDAP